MALDERVLEALKLENLDLPPEMMVLKITPEEYVDWTGDDALRVSVLLSDDLDEDAVTGESVSRLKLSIYDSLVGHGINLFPYVRFMKPSDLLPEQHRNRNHARRSA